MTTKKKCTPFCHPSCIIEHHPILIPLLNSRSAPEGVETNVTSSCFRALEAVIQKSEKDGSWNRDDDIPDDDPDYRFPLIHWASALGRVDIVQWLIAKKFSVMTVHKETGDTALNNALLSLQEIFKEKDKAIKVFKELLKLMAGALTVRNNTGNSLLHICCHNYHLQEPRMEYFADCIHSILDLAKKRSSSFVANLVNLQNNEGNTPVHILAQEDRNYSILKSVIDTEKVDLSIKNSEMKTAFDVAIDSGQLKVSSYLRDMCVHDVRAISQVIQREYGKSIANSTRHSNEKRGTLLEVSSTSSSDDNNAQNVSNTTVKPVEGKSPSSGKYVIKSFKQVAKNSQVQNNSNKKPEINNKSTVKNTSNNNKQKHNSSKKHLNNSAEMERSTVSTASTASTEQCSNKPSQRLVPFAQFNTNKTDLSPSKSASPGIVAVPVHVHGSKQPLQQGIIRSLGNNMTVTLKGATKVYGTKATSDNNSSFYNLLNNNIMFHPLNSNVPSPPDPTALTSEMLLHAIKPLSEQNNSGSSFSSTPSAPSTFSSTPSASKIKHIGVIYRDNVTNNPTVTKMLPVITARSTVSSIPSITTLPSHSTLPHTTGDSDTTHEQNEVTSTVPPFPNEAIVRHETSQEAGNKHVHLTDSSTDYRPPHKKSRFEGGSLAITNVVSLSSKTSSGTEKQGDQFDVLDVESTSLTDHCNLPGSTEPTSSSITGSSDQQKLSTSSKTDVLEKAFDSPKPNCSQKLNGTSGSSGKKKTDSCLRSVNASGSIGSEKPNNRLAGNDSSSGSRSSSCSQASCNSLGTAGSNMSSSTETTNDSSGSGGSNICDRSKAARDSKEPAGSQGYGALLKYLSFCESDTKIGILDALNKDKDRYMEDKKQLQEQVKVVNKEKSKLTADIKQKTSRVKSLLNELDRVQKDLLHLSEIKKQNDAQAEDIKTELRTTDLKLKHLHDALAEFK